MDMLEASKNNIDKSLFLKTLGVFVIQNSFMTWWAICNYFDLVLKTDIDSTTSANTIMEIMQMPSYAQKELKTLLESVALTNEDIDFCNDFISIYDSLHEQANSAHLFFRTGEDQYLELWGKHRTEAYNAITCYE